MDVTTNRFCNVHLYAVSAKFSRKPDLSLGPLHVRSLRVGCKSSAYTGITQSRKYLRTISGYISSFILTLVILAHFTFNAHVCLNAPQTHVFSHPNMVHYSFPVSKLSGQNGLSIYVIITSHTFIVIGSAQI